MDIEMDRFSTQRCDNSTLAIQRYLHSFDKVRQLSLQILRVLNEDQRTAHRERVNANRNPIRYKPGDIVTVRIQKQSDKDSGTVEKLEFNSRGPFKVIEYLGHGSYRLRPFQKPNAATRQHKGIDLHPIPPSIDYRYLNQHRAPILHPLRKSMGIDSYNHLWLGENDTTPRQTDHSFPEPFVTNATNDNILSIS